MKFNSTTALLNCFGCDLVRAYVRGDYAYQYDRGEDSWHYWQKQCAMWWKHCGKPLAKWHTYYPKMWVHLVQQQLKQALPGSKNKLM